MSYPRLLWLLPLLVLQNGCALLNTSYTKNNSQIEQWVSEKEYGRALKTLSRVSPKDPHYLEAAEKRNQIEALAATYEHDIRQKNRKLLDEGKWAQALDSYDEALRRLPESVVLKDGLAKLHRRQAKELGRLELERLMYHGAWLKQTLPTYRDIARVDPRSSSARRRLERMQEEAEEIADELALHGNRALANNNLDKAADLLNLAADLSPAPAIQESLKKLNQQRSSADKQAQIQRKRELQQKRTAERRRQEKVERLRAAFDRDFGQNNFTTARKHLQALASAGMPTAHYRALQRKFDRALDNEASRLFEIGVNAYSRAQYAKAAGYWRQALELKPDNKQAKEHLERAERVLEKLKKLKEKQN
ncbi:MAG: hypothetical protein R6X15_03480 [Pseudomonadota bacterium]